ncbi:unnamed protein product [Somion occarium]
MGSKRRHRPEVSISAASPLDEDDATRKAVMEIVQVWLDRLQLISIITTFFASIDGLLLGFSSNIAQLGVKDVFEWDNSLQLMMASFSGALIFHVCSAITSFTGSFILIRFKLLDAKQHEHEIEVSTGSAHPSTANLPLHTTSEKEKAQVKVHRARSNPIPAHLTNNIVPTRSGRTKIADTANISNTSLPPHLSRTHTTNSLHNLAAAAEHSLDFLPNWSDIFNSFQGRVCIDRVHPFAFVSPRRRKSGLEGPEGGKGSEDQDTSGTELDPPVKLLTRCHSLSTVMAVCGFVLACVGILAFLWTSLPRSVGIFGSACLGVCLISGAVVFNLA